MFVQSVCCLRTLHDSSFGYGLTNGTIGVYDRSSRLWRIKVCLRFLIILFIRVYRINSQSYHMMCAFSFLSQTQAQSLRLFYSRRIFQYVSKRSTSTPMVSLNSSLDGVTERYLFQLDDKSIWLINSI